MCHLCLLWRRREVLGAGCGTGGDQWSGNSASAPWCLFIPGFLFVRLFCPHRGLCWHFQPGSSLCLLAESLWCCFPLSSWSLSAVPADGRAVGFTRGALWLHELSPQALGMSGNAGSGERGLSLMDRLDGRGWVAKPGEVLAVGDVDRSGRGSTSLCPFVPTTCH